MHIAGQRFVGAPEERPIPPAQREGDGGQRIGAVTRQLVVDRLRPNGVRHADVVLKQRLQMTNGARLEEPQSIHHSITK